jgi:hypothetical protein
VAMGARGATASSEAADVVITVDRLDRLPEGIRIARRARRIALESVVVGMGLSLVAMLFAAGGYLPPVAGALVQEVIDVIVILNALRALTGGVERSPKIPGWGDLGARLQSEHRDLAPAIAGLRFLADALGDLPPAEARGRLEGVRTLLIRLADRMVGELPEEGPAPEDLNDLRRVLYGLDAILRLHMAQEEELYTALGDGNPTAATTVTASA